MLDDGQPEPGPAPCPGAPRVDAKEPLGQARDVLRRDADAGVQDRAVGTGLVLEPTQADPAAFGGVLQGVLQQVVEDTAELLRVSGEPQTRIEARLDAMAPRAAQPELLLQVGEDRRDVHWLVGARRLAVRLQAGQKQQVLHQTGHAARLLGHGLHGAPPDGRQLLALVLQRLQVARDHGEGRAQLVGDVGHEVAPDLLETRQLRDVPGEQQTLVGAVADQTDGEEHVPVLRRGKLDRSRLPLALQEILEQGVAHQVRHTLPQVLGHLQAEQPTGRGVEPLDPVFTVQDDRGVRECRHRLAQALEGIGELALALARPLVDAVHLLVELAPDASSGWRMGLLPRPHPALQTVELQEDPGGVGERRQQQGRQRVTRELPQGQGTREPGHEAADLGSPGVAVHGQAEKR